MHDYLLRRTATSETIKPRSIFIHQLRHQLFSAPLPPLLLLLLLLLFSNHCCFHLSRVTCASPGGAELTTLPLSRINKLGYTTREDCCDPLHLWVISMAIHFLDPVIRVAKIYLSICTEGQIPSWSTMSRSMFRDKPESYRYDYPVMVHLIGPN